MHDTMKKIVIAEDSAAGRELLHELVESWGYEVIEATDGREALQKIMETAPDLVLCDIQMPEQDGYAVIQSLRRDPRFTKLPVIALTAFAMRGDKEKALAAGFDGHQSKPVEFESLKAEIERLLVT
jgi:two-component system, cell cycle response regulator DivK